MNKKNNKKKKQSIFKKKIFKGFTLVELLAVIVVLAIIMIIAIPSVLGVMKSSKQKSFVEYVSKMRTLGEQTYLSDELNGTTLDTCTMYDITSDLDLDNLGAYKGYIVAVKQNNVIKYYLTIWNDDYMVYGIEYNDDLTTDLLVDYNSDSLTTYLSKENLAGIGECTVYTNRSDGTTGSGNINGAASSSPVKYTGIAHGSNGWTAHYTDSVMDECYYNNNKEDYCTGSYLSSDGSKCPEHKSLDCCTGSTSTSYYHYTSSDNVCWDGQKGGNLPSDGITKKTLIGSNGWTANYLCKDGKGTMETCISPSQFGFVTCDGGSNNAAINTMCTSSKTYYYVPGFCNSSATVGRSYGGGLPSSITC